MECPASAEPTHCTCTSTSCPRHGRCCACVAHHRRSGEIPGCFFSREGEALWDRSFATFLRDQRRS